MIVEGKTAVVFGGGGAIGGAVARVLAREGAHVFVAGPTRAKLDRVAEDIRAAGGKAEAIVVDLLDERATAQAAARIAARNGGIDVAMNAAGFAHDQGTAIGELSLADFMHPLETFLPALFNMARAVAPHMGARRTGVILTVTAPAGRLAVPGHVAHIVTSAAEEAFARALASELGPRNVRVACIRSHALSDAIAAGSYTAGIFAPKAEAMGLTVEQWLGGAASTTMTGRLPTLSQVAETAAFLASDHAGAVTGTVVNLTAGFTFDG